uniref:Uncharacterized protein n=1 Tax=Heterorhabditis bacteriophora TaxID=37862 RepID=A0A1I7WA77_HETBA
MYTCLCIHMGKSDHPSSVFHP